MPKSVVLNLVRKPFATVIPGSLLFRAASKPGPFGHGNSPTEAVDNLVDVAELTLRAASDSPAFIELEEVR
jgi:hypothetical protein